MIRRNKRQTWTLLLSLTALAVGGCQTTTEQPLRLETAFSGASQPSTHARSPKRRLTDFFVATPSANDTLAPNDTVPPVHPLLAKPEPSTMDKFRQTAASLASNFTPDSHADNRIATNDPTSLQSPSQPIGLDLHLSAARMLEQQGNLSGALQHYAQILAQQPNNRHALIGQARLMHRLGNMDAALQTYRTALKRLGDDPVVLNDYGLCLARSEKPTEAVSTLRTALQLQPNNAMYRNNLAAVLVQADRPDQAVDVLAKAHGAVIAHYNVAYLLNQRGYADLAHFHFSESLRHDPGFAPARTMMDRIAPVIGRRAPVNDQAASVSKSAQPVTEPSRSHQGTRQPDQEVLVAVQKALGEVHPAASVPNVTGQVAPASHVVESSPGDSSVVPASAVLPLGNVGQIDATAPAQPPEIRMPTPLHSRDKSKPGMMAPLPRL